MQDGTGYEGSRADASRAELADALADLIVTDDFGSVTVTQICQRAGLSRNTFYRCFSDKEAVFSHLVTRQVEDFHKHCLRTPAIRAGHLSSHEVFQVFFAYWACKREFLRAVLRGGLYVRFAGEFERALCEHVVILDDCLGEAERGYLAACISSTLMALLSHWADRGFAETIPQMVGIAELANRIPTLEYQPGA